MSKSKKRIYRPTPHRLRPILDVLERRITPASFAVANTLDSGAGSLRQAISDANGSAGADTITFNAGVTGTITLTSGELSIMDDLTITGPGAANLTINGNNAGRVFNVNNASVVLNVALSGMTVTGGRITSGDGGGIYSTGDNVTLDSMVISGNTVAGTTSDGGGGIATGSGGVFTIRNTTISGNSTVGRGGGVYFYNNGGLLLENSTISGNSSTGTTIGGGGIYFYGTVGASGFTIRNSTIAGNSAPFGSGGGIHLRGTAANGFNGTALIQNSTITNNSSGTAATAAGSGGGGIAVAVGTANSILTLQSTIVSGNTANAGNGNADIAATAATTVNVNNCAIGVSNGFTLSGSSGSNLAFGAALNLGVLSNNGGLTQTVAIQAGSAAINAGSNPASLTTDQRGTGFPRVQGGLIDIGAFENNPAIPTASGTFANVTTGGGTTYSFTVTYSDSVSINVGSLDNNDIRVTGPNGYNQLATFVSVTPAGNGSPRTATYTIPAPGGTFDLGDNGTYTASVEANQVFNTGGNPIAASSLGTFQVLTPGTFTVTTNADSGTGSLRDVITQANASANVDTISFAPTVTGTISLQSALPTITNPITLTGPGASVLTVRRDPAAGSTFRVLTIGGISPFSSTVSGLTISGGVTSGTVLGTRGGGGIAINATKTLTVLDSIITGNTASGEGGGIYVGIGSTLTVRNSTVSGNTAGTDSAATYRVGGGIYMRSGGTLTVENSTVSGNTSPTQGGGIYMYGGGTVGNWTIRNSTIANNSAPSGGGVLVLTTNGAHTLTFQNTTITGNTATTGAGGLQISGTNAAVTLTSTVIANNTGTSPDVLGALTANFSLVRDQTGATVTGSNNLAAGTDPLFATAGLASNGGSTLTIALQSGSPLINAGSNPATLTTDQRGPGFLRVSGSAADIGSFEVQSATAAPQVASVVGNTGAGQRSRVTAITVTFNSVVTFSGPVASAFQIRRIGGGAVGAFTASAATVGGVTVVTLTNFTGLETVGPNGSASLVDGRYQVTVLAAQVSAGGLQLDGDGNGTGGDNYVLNGTPLNGLFRYYGDFDGDGDVDGSDLFQYVPTLFNPANYALQFDFDSDGDVDGTDLFEFVQNLFVPLP
ncbi:MAG: right-handed parallel beta-helix repeat-containing protein [Gemmataceae bacterium]